MEEIKFRQYNERTKEMVFFDFFDVYGGELDNNISIYNPMQYTGFFDKQGVDIYEGDIVEVILYNEKHFFEVIWGIDGFKVHNNKGAYNSLFLYANISEVVGNIYENLELLDKK